MNSLIRFIVIAAAVALLTIAPASAKGSHTYNRSISSHSHQRSAHGTVVHTRSYYTACARDASGRIGASRKCATIPGTPVCAAHVERRLQYLADVLRACV
jgi:hypothetical protein